MPRSPRGSQPGPPRLCRTRAVSSGATARSSALRPKARFSSRETIDGMSPDGKRALAAGAELTVADLAPHAVATELGARALELDVRDETQVAAAMADLDLLVNVAGIGSTTNAPDTPLYVWENVFAVNARGTFLCCKHAIPGMA